METSALVIWVLSIVAGGLIGGVVARLASLSLNRRLDALAARLQAVAQKERDLADRTSATHSELDRVHGRLTPEAASILNRMATRTGDARSDILGKALTLYEAALDEQQEGNRLAFLNAQDEIVREVTGIGHEAEAAATASAE